MSAGEPTAPSQPTIKRLFAKSGDRCAFPNCSVTVVQGKTIVADMCHIKAASPAGPRYDPSQTAVERYSFENLILLCANHHRVIDDDPEQYTVAILEKMKRDHEAAATTPANDIIERATELLAEQAANANGTGESNPANQHAPAKLSHAHERELAVRANTFHRERLDRIDSGQGAVSIMDGGLFVFHIVPVQSFEI